MARKKQKQGKRGATKRSASSVSRVLVGAARAQAAGIRKVGDRFFDRQGKRLSAQSARQRVERREARQAQQAERERELERRRRQRRLKQKTRVIAAQPSKALSKKPVPAAAHKIHRDRQGRFVSHAESKRLATERRIELKHRKQRLAEGQQSRLQFAVPLVLHNRLCQEFEKISKAVRKENSSLHVETMCSSAGATFDAMVDISGFPQVMTLTSDETLVDMKAMVKARKEIVRSLIEAQKSIRKRRGLLVAVTLAPVESLMLYYGRDAPLMTTQWLRADRPDEINTLVMRMKKMLESLWANRWEVERLQVKFRYDHEVALRGYITTPEMGEMEVFNRE